MIAMTTGTTLIMWLGEKISEKGIGNGISIIIAMSIIASYPMDAGITATMISQKSLTPLWIPIVMALCVGVSITIIMMHLGARKIPIQHAKRIVGRRIVSGSTTYLPLKVNQAGVIPVIFSSAILSFPNLLLSLAGVSGSGFFRGLSSLFQLNSDANLYALFGLTRGGALYIFRSVNVYTMMYALLTIFFCYFYTAITFNPVDTAENLKKYGAFIPGRRPGKPTSDYIDFVLTRITLVGALYLVAIALMPNVLYISYRVPWGLTDFVGGVGLIIVVDVFLDTMKQVESHLLMRHYEGFKLRKGARGRW